ncbi:MAG: hypothetical protein KME09_07935 [Pleurocapsa minor HA4230-MV1]|jgi:hypothetical protein|nr:hypothetical protein [Pleurocapsa minor HA4230-MV1]
MKLIREIVKQALNTGYLTLEAEEKLKKMLKTKYELEDLEAFINLQQATMLGMVKQESKEIFAASRNCF